MCVCVKRECGKRPVFLQPFRLFWFPHNNAVGDGPKLLEIVLHADCNGRGGRGDQECTLTDDLPLTFIRIPTQPTHKDLPAKRETVFHGSETKNGGHFSPWLVFGSFRHIRGGGGASCAARRRNETVHDPEREMDDKGAAGSLRSRRLNSPTMRCAVFMLRLWITGLRNCLVFHAHAHVCRRGNRRYPS